MKKVDFELLEEKIVYKNGYKYQLKKDASIKIELKFIKELDIKFITYKEGILTAKEGYAWDGPSGPTIDTKDFMRGSLFHDVLYQLMREGYISKDYRESADSLLFYICEKDNMPLIRRLYVYQGVNTFGGILNKYSKDSLLQAP